MKLYCATTNRGKLREFQKALEDSEQVQVLPGLASIAPCEETGATFEENAVQKALYYSKFCDGYLFVDDSGLEVEAHCFDLADPMRRPGWAELRTFGFRIGPSWRTL